jgi:hypothetical protein
MLMMWALGVSAVLGVAANIMPFKPVLHVRDCVSQLPIENLTMLSQEASKCCTRWTCPNDQEIRFNAMGLSSTLSILSCRLSMFIHD